MQKGNTHLRISRISYMTMINKLISHNKQQILTKILWNNHFIKIKGFSVYYQSLHEAGVITFKDTFLGENNCRKFAIKTNFLIYMVSYATQFLKMTHNKDVLKLNCQKMRNLF